MLSTISVVCSHPKLKALQVSNATLDEGELQVLCSFCQTLRNLEVLEVDSISISREWDYLASLDISYLADLTSLVFLEISGSFAGRFAVDKGVDEVLTQCTCLSGIRISGCSFWDGLSLRSNSLRSMHLQMAPDSFPPASVCCPQLTSLHIDSLQVPRECKDQHLLLSLSDMPLLQSLRLSTSDFCGANVLQDMITCLARSNNPPPLHSLCVPDFKLRRQRSANQRQILDIGPLAVLRDSLETLELSCCSKNVEFVGIQALREACPRLKDLLL
ncbi:hypothetical protein DUNSADRAFT_11810 [Dunaliella salina]|uniref:Uncharacterized protein n=1 Tax=Dunaliella salina TaxID=3046 RepID=A0ABQ7GCN6_DUNSA|nr:hypothetical protein DUNSADRAFT_11810 [Dunaliella salina]|eukprot:KAF5832334.1 hypothetical protein DUNSADRAFT_11810 [Dunaliella salina]